MTALRARIPRNRTESAALAGDDGSCERVETLLAMMLRAPAWHIPGCRREWLAEEARREGIGIGVALLGRLRALRTATEPAVHGTER
jgi:hypothetical protein